jgi:A/G-specific adenine glycosylase
VAGPPLSMLQGRHVGASRSRDCSIVAALCGWFARSARPLPWRTPGDQPRDPYAALVSEVMLQQTQVSRVVEKFGQFLGRFPTVAALADAPEEEVLAVWSGMGYYRRARHLQAAARAIVERHGGEVPCDAATLRQLPGVGRYTAGALASIVFGKAVPTVDGNIARVLQRLEGCDMTAGDGVAWAWGRSRELVSLAGRARELPRSWWEWWGSSVSRGSAADPRPTAGPGVLNEALMELGATVCTPRSPRCGNCPLVALCRAAGQDPERIPRPRVRPLRGVLYCAVLLLVDENGRVLVEQRGPAGMWAKLWQAPTLESARPIRRGDMERAFGTRGLRRSQQFDHTTTHRDVRFAVWTRPFAAAVAGQVAAARPGVLWKPASELSSLGLSSPQRRILLGPRETPG